MNLHVIDVSPHIHVGSITKGKFFEGEVINTPNGWKQLTIPTGGISFLFNKIFEFSKGNTMVFACDRPATNRKNIDSAYKANRGEKPDVDSQKIIVERILEDCGFQVLYEDGYEADDIIYSIVQKYKHDPSIDHIYVHTDDSDLYINVDDKVSILQCSSRGKNITRANYETTVSKKEVIPYNSLTFRKMLEGDTADGVKGLPKDMRSVIYNFFMNQPALRDNLHVPGIVEAAIKARFDNPLLIKNFQLIYPHEVDVFVDLANTPDYNKTGSWGAAVQNSNYYRFNVTKDIKAQIEGYFKEEGFSDV